MRITQPTTPSEALPYVNIRLQGCSDTVVGFDFLGEQPVVGKRRYCNKVLVHECITIIEPEPIALDKVEFISTDDPCYTVFNLYKSSDAIEEIDPTITIQVNDDGLAIGILINFAKAELCCLPMKMAYRIYGTTPEGARILLANGLVYASPCSCSELVDVPGSSGGIFWTDVDW